MCVTGAPVCSPQDELFFVSHTAERPERYQVRPTNPKPNPNLKTGL